MQIRIFIFSILALLFISCDRQIELSQLKGSWIPTNSIDNTGMNLSEEMTFDENGNYSGVMLSNGDSLVSEVSGEYHVDKSSKTITIKFTAIFNGKLDLESVSDTSYVIQIIELTASTLRLETPNGIIMKYKKK